MREAAWAVQKMTGWKKASIRASGFKHTVIHEKCAGRS